MVVNFGPKLIKQNKLAGHLENLVRDLRYPRTTIGPADSSPGFIGGGDNPLRVTEVLRQIR